MRTYENKDELKNEINKSFAKYISEFNDIPEHLKDKRIDEIDRKSTRLNSSHSQQSRMPSSA